MVIAAALPPRAFDRTLIPANSCLTFCRQKRQGQDRYRSFGPGLKEALATLISGNALFLPLFREGTTHYASGRELTNRAKSLLSSQWGESMSLDVQVVNPLIALIAGILILLMPRLLNYVVAIYLIVIGVLGLAHHFNM
jgi:hypothetical protein